MRLSKFTDLSLRVLMYLGLCGPDKKVPVLQICDAFSVSHNHLLKVVAHLAQANFIETTRGKHGGIRLAWLPDEISLGVVVRSTESPLKSIECFEPFCPIVSSCRIPAIFSEATESWLGVLDSYTIGDLIRPGNFLRESLKIPANSEEIQGEV